MQWYVHKRTSDNLIKHILNLRGVDNYKKFINPPHPSSLKASDVKIEKKDLQKAANRLRKAIKNKEKVVVYGDYDVDGITGTAVLWETLYSMGAEAFPFIPDRASEGYGFSKKGIDKVIKKYNPSLIVSVDHGITAFEEIKYLQKEGIDVVVTDHHQEPEEEEKIQELKKKVKAIVHTTELSGAGVSWYLSRYLTQEDNDDYLALAAFGTIADIVPLLFANRSIAKYGLPAIEKSQKAGIKALIEEAGICKEQIEPYHIEFILGPRINAAGRIDKAIDALRLLCTNDSKSAEGLARKLGILNRQRQEKMRQQVDFSFNQIGKKTKLPPIIIMADENYDDGIIGLVAGKLAERFCRPAIVIARSEKISKASARSVEGVNIIELLRKAKDLLLSVGGHKMAAGFSVQTEDIPQVAEELLRIAGDTIEPESLKKTIKIDAQLSLEEVNKELYQRLSELEPFGCGNPRPLFACYGVILADTRTVGQQGKHLKFKVNGIDAIAFGRGYLLDKLDFSKPVNLAYWIDLNRYNGREALQLKVRDITQS